jgi:hypothetical protein
MRFSCMFVGVHVAINKWILNSQSPLKIFSGKVQFIHFFDILKVAAKNVDHVMRWCIIFYDEWLKCLQTVVISDL